MALVFVIGGALQLFSRLLFRTQRGCPHYITALRTARGGSASGKRRLPEKSLLPDIYLPWINPKKAKAGVTNGTIEELA
jgi:hypothetical protein